MPSPLFPNFNRRQRDALRAFRETKFGRAVSDARRRNRGDIPQSDFGRLGNKFSDSLTNEVMRYGADAFWKGLTSRLGPVGSLIESLLRPRGKQISESPRQELDAAQALLEQFGYTVKPPERIEMTPRGEVRVRVGPRVYEDDAGTESGPASPPTGPDIEGMIEVTSSNVHSIGYEWPTADRLNPGNLMVRFLGGTGKQRSGPGPLYRYHHVPYPIFEAFQIAASKGKFVWSELRVRGTVSGHQYSYDLAGTGGDGYIPRQAGLKRGWQGEWYLKRSYQGRESRLPERAVRRGTHQLQGFDRVDQMRFRAGRRK